jgi:hypothetical protein
MALRTPRQHDRVTVQGHNGVLTVVDIDKQLKTAALQFVTGDGPVLQSIPWADLRYMDEEDGSESAAPIVEEKPDKD